MSFLLCKTEDFLDDSAGRESACNAGGMEEVALIPGSGRSPGEGNGKLLQYSCLENPMERGVWQARVLRGAKSWSNMTKHTCVACKTKAKVLVWNPQIPFKVEVHSSIS